jgi:hypothetical protein
MPNNNLPPLPDGYTLDSPSDNPELPEGYKVDRATRHIKFRGGDGRIYQVPHHNLAKVKKVHKGVKVLPN